MPAQSGGPRERAIVNVLSHLVIAASSTPAVPTGDAARAIGPGFAGFVATALMVIAVIFLIRDMTRRVRRVRYAGTAESRQADLVERGKALQGDEDFPPPGTGGTASGSGPRHEGTQDDAGNGAGGTPAR